MSEVLDAIALFLWAVAGGMACGYALTLIRRRGWIKVTKR